MNGSLLAIGGLGAAAVALWQQARNVFGYISSFVIVSAALDHNLAEPVMIYLRSHWRAVPSGQWYYHGIHFSLRDRSLLVPFRMRSKRSIYFSGARFVVTTGASVWSIRGMVNFDDLVSAALDYHTERTAVSFSVRPDRYQFRRIVGTAKGWGADSKHRGRDDGHSSPPQGEVTRSSDAECPDPTVDRSFKFAREEYLPTERDVFEHLYFSPDIMARIGQAEMWFDKREWYRDRDIPWRLGWLLYGPGGTGKSSLAEAVARRLRVPIYVFSLGTLSDQEFISEWESMYAPCVAVFEDFDTVFRGREPLTEHKQLTFETVLNQISGIGSHNGVFLIVTTNHIEAIDEAMGVSQRADGISTRPGRIDAVIELGPMTEDNRRRLAGRILQDWPHLIERTVRQGHEMTPAQFQELCVQHAFEQMVEASPRTGIGSARLEKAA